MCEEVTFDGEFGNVNFKSCFARSLAVNSQYKHTKSLDLQQLPGVGVYSMMDETVEHKCVDKLVPTSARSKVNGKKNLKNEMKHDGNHTHHTGNPAPWIPEIPVENIANDSRIETLEWQIKEIQKSREMYRAVLKQVVTYLEKVHNNLELLESKIDGSKLVDRSDSRFQSSTENRSIQNTSSMYHGVSCATSDEISIKESLWQQNESANLSITEVSPEKLSQEAFRLLRIAQSLLNTQEPDLSHVTSQVESDVHFLTQLAKEFPNPDLRPLSTTSFSLSPRLNQLENEAGLSSTFNRHLSLQHGDVRRYLQSHKRKTGSTIDSTRGNNIEEKTTYHPSLTSGSISSIEDESGFSSLNSFQEVGIPTSSLKTTCEVSAKDTSLCTMMQNTLRIPSISQEEDSQCISAVSKTPFNNQDGKQFYDDFELWQKPAATANSTPLVHHRRWLSTPIQDAKAQSVKVLWV